MKHVSLPQRSLSRYTKRHSENSDGNDGDDDDEQQWTKMRKTRTACKNTTLFVITLHVKSKFLHIYTLREEGKTRAPHKLCYSFMPFSVLFTNSLNIFVGSFLFVPVFLNDVETRRMRKNTTTRWLEQCSIWESRLCIYIYILVYILTYIYKYMHVIHIYVSLCMFVSTHTYVKKLGILWEFYSKM